jgi:hypothetical protein
MSDEDDTQQRRQEYQRWQAENAEEIAEQLRRSEREGQARLEAAAVSGYARSADFLLHVLGAVGATDAFAVKAAQAQARVALSRRITMLAESADVESLHRLVDAYYTLAELDEDFGPPVIALDDGHD